MKVIKSLNLPKCLKLYTYPKVVNNLYKQNHPNKIMTRVMVADLMTHEPITIKPDTNLLDCIKELVKKRIGCLIIAEKKELKGFISSDDILWVLTKKPKEDLSSIKAKDISPKKIVSIRPDATIDEALKKMKKTKFERLPVLQNKEVVGLITAKDILNFHPEIYPELKEFAKIREESRKLKQLKTKEMSSTHEGICEECGNQELLYKINGMWVCESCKETIH